MRLRIVTLAALACVACTRIPDPSPWDGGRRSDAGRDAGPARQCLISPSGGLRGALAFERAATTPGRGLVWSWLYLDSRTDEDAGRERWILELSVVGRLDDALGRVVDLGGDQASLATCTHCVVAWRSCASDPALCSGEPYVAISGRAYVHELPILGVDAGMPSTGFEMELQGVELAPARVDDVTLATQIVGGDCILIDSVRFGGVPGPDECARSKYACALGRAAETR